MKKTKKHWAFILTSIALIVGLLSGCAGGGTQNGEQSAPENNANQVTLKLHFWYNEDQDNWKTVYSEFQKKYPNIKIEAVTAGDNNANEYLKRLDLASASGDQIDIMMFSNATYYSQRVTANMLEPLNDYIAKDGFKMEDEYYMDTTYGDTVYGLPAKKNIYFVMMNKNHLDEAGLSVPKDWTWDEFLDYSKKLTKGEGASKRYGTYFHTFSQYYHMALSNQPDDYFLVKPDGKTLNIDSPLVRRSLEIRQQAEMVDKSATPYSETMSQKLNYRPQYFNEKTSMILTGDFMIPEAGGSDKVPANFPTVFAPYPKVNKTDPISTITAGDIMAVSSKSKHKQEAYDFVRWYTTEGIQLQGKYMPAWKKADLNKVIDTLIASSKTPDMIDKETLMYTMTNSISQKYNIPLPFNEELEVAFKKDVEKFLLGEADMDATINSAVQKAQEIIENSK
ncbi:extracellular solute-binding protein [Paenibacillus sp. LHD-38]|uniref:ABC transporter substrate-binding protein n=1 Tax=Paenibacillus sp. LHD-38 TaxID=3072143 RepID=UPI00280DBEF0|nr:extracellular solute-binding protein [Paenibacillus sp. LHD-38]MDQ8733922.1 extracellular solute-binding protein [Paenibacillus sp. LHD-38]